MRPWASWHNEWGRGNGNGGTDGPEDPEDPEDPENRTAGQNRWNYEYGIRTYGIVRTSDESITEYFTVVDLGCT